MATRHSAVVPSEKTHSVVFNGCKEDGETGNRLSESILSKCCGPSAARKDTLALACSRGQKRHSRLSKNILTVLCAFASRHLLCKGLQRWSLPAHCLFHVSSLPLRSFKPNGDIHHWRLLQDLLSIYVSIYLAIYLSIYSSIHLSIYPSIRLSI